MKKKDALINIRISAEFLERVRTKSKESGVPYSVFVRCALEAYLEDPRATIAAKIIPLRSKNLDFPR